MLANWPPGFSGRDYIAKAHASARMLAAASHEAGIPVGIGVHAGDAYMCSVRALRGAFRDVSVFGAAVNLTARLSDRAGAGEVVVSRADCDALGLGGPWESLALKGFEQPVEARRIQS